MIAGKDSQKLSDYYERLGGNHYGRYEKQTFHQAAPPMPAGQDSRFKSLPRSRLDVEDIEGTSPNAFGNAAKFKNKDSSYMMQTIDIPGARPRYLEE